jgi:threonine synthase
MSKQFECHSCSARYDLTELVWRCKCGGMLDLVKEKVIFNPSQLQKELPTMWCYHHVLPFESDIWQTVTMGEGYTPLIVLDENEPNTFVKKSIT